jgi:hypothetical protein
LSAEIPDRTIQLQRFAVGHPNAIGLAQALGYFGASIPTYTAHDSCFELELSTPLGIVSL